MSGISSILSNVDCVCGQLALALHNSELQIYGTLTVILMLSMLLFPPRDDPDQV